MSILDTFSLAGKTALVTGGAGMYGRQIALALAEAGARTYIASRDLNKLGNLSAELRARDLDVRALPLDQASEDSVIALRDSILKDSGDVQVLVNNSVSRPMKKGWDDSAEAFAESMAVNATGLFTVTRAFGDRMADAGGGSIINVGSIQGLVGPDPTIYKGTGMHGFYPDYFFHKGGMINFTRFVASYYGARGVRCNCVCPGGLQTESHPEAFVDHYSERTMLGRMAGPDDLMGSIVFLASDASRYVTAATIPVDGGYTAK